MSSSNTNNIINILNDSVIYMYKYIVPLLYITSNIGNLLSAIIFSKRSWKKNICVFYFKVYLFSTSSYNNWNILASIFTSGYNIQLQNSSDIFCKIYIYLSYLFASICPTVLILASFDRLLISSQNVGTRLYSSKRLAYFSISLSTLFWVIYNSHLLFKSGIQQYYPTVFICYYDLSKIYTDFINYSSMVISISWWFLMIILSVASYKNIRHISPTRRHQRNQIRVMTKKDFQLLRCLFVQVIVFITFSVCININFVYSSITKDRQGTVLEQALNNFVSKLCIVLYDMGYCTIFFVFIGISKAFRQEFKRLIYKMFGKNGVILREEENRQDHIELRGVVVNTITS